MCVCLWVKWGDRIKGLFGSVPLERSCGHPFLDIRVSGTQRKSQSYRETGDSSLCMVFKAEWAQLCGKREEKGGLI